MYRKNVEYCICVEYIVESKNEDESSMIIFELNTYPNFHSKKHCTKLKFECINNEVSFPSKMWNNLHHLLYRINFYHLIFSNVIDFPF